MRNLFLLLVLLNFGAFAFFNWVIGEPAPSQMYDGAGIRLLRELDPNAPLTRSAGTDPVAAELSPDEFGDPPPAEDETADELSVEAASSSDNPEPIAALASNQAEADLLAAIDEPLGRCISIGPFRADAESDTAMATLAEAGFDPSRSVREVEVWDGYWVFIEQIENFSSAQTIQTDLADDGLADTQIISGSERGTLLSLGVFSEITRAGAQAERVSRIGYEATIADNMATRETQWLDVTLSNEQSIALETLQAPGQISRLELLPCLGGDGD